MARAGQLHVRADLPGHNDGFGFLGLKIALLEPPLSTSELVENGQIGQFRNRA